MLVLMRDSGFVQFACRALQNAEVCGVCKRAIQIGEYYTRHQAPDPRTRTRAGRVRMVPYNACTSCAPYTQLEQNTGEITLPQALQRAKLEAEETFVELPIVRASTPHPIVNTSIPRPIRAVRLERDESWLR